MTDDDKTSGRRERLSSAKRALLQARLRGETQASQEGAASIPKRDPDVAAPLSLAQRRLWFLDQLEPGSLAHVLPGALRVSGPVDADALRDALAEIVRRHEALRTVFRVAAQNEPVQALLPEDSIRLQIEDLRAYAASEREQRATRWLAEEAVRPFDLAIGPLFRVTWLRLADDTHIIATTAHHAIWDGWSAGVFISELQTLYAGFSRGQPATLGELAIQYGDYANWQRQKFRSDDDKDQLALRVERLRGAPARLELPTDRPRPAIQTVNGAMYPFKLSASLSDGLTELSLQQGATLFMTLLAAFTTLLSRYSGQKDIVVGTPVAGRGLPEMEALIGLFANTLCLRTDLTGNPTFRDLIARVREEALTAFSHQELPFEQLVEELQPERNRSHSPLFQVMFALQNLPAQTLGLAGAEMTSIAPVERASPFDMTLYVWEDEKQLQGAFEYNTDLFDPSTIARMFHHYETLLTSAVADPEQRVSSLALLTSSEQQLLSGTWNATVADYPTDTILSQLFEHHVAATPEAVAVVFEGRSLTYRELDERSNQLARYLQSVGVGPDVLVGVAMEREPEMLVALLGVLKAGGAYLPLDPGFPIDRLAFMLSNAEVRLLLTQESLREFLPAAQIRIVSLDLDWEVISTEDTSAPINAAGPENLAYVIYTSGSTGQPKGVQIPHRAVVNFLTSMQQEPGLSRNDVLVSVTTLSFDISVLEIFLPLCSGARLVLVSRATASDGEALAAAMSNSSATVMQATPTTWRLLIESGWSGDGQLKALCGGEAWSRDLADELLQRCGSVWNMYGPTETTIWSAVQRIERGDGPVLIGEPIANTRLHVLDEAMQPVPIGVPGELYIGGAGLAHGYLNHPDLTAERFVADPFVDDDNDARLYRTGDLVRRQPDGRLEFQRRLDHQVKIRGFRIELGEIEAALASEAAVSEVVVLAREDVAGDQRLVAYLVAESGATLNSGELRRSAASQLPEYMVPTAWVMLDALPLTPNRKIDRKALPAPDATRAEADFVQPGNPDEEVLAGIWAEVLHMDRVSVHDNFFALGGHSLLATQVIARVRDALQVELPLRAVFEAPTIAALSERTRDLRGGDGGLPEPPLVAAQHEGPIPLSFAQQRLWFFDQLEPGSTAYNIFGALRLGGPLDVAALHKSLNDILRRHEVLRTAITSIDGQPTQLVIAASELDLPMEDLTELPEGERDAAVSRQIDTEAKRSFDLTTPPLIRSRLLRLGDDEHILLISVHHIAADGWSQALLVRELSHSYAAHLAGKTPELPLLPIQYSDYAQWQRSWLQGSVLESQLEYWQDQLSDNLPTLDLPTDHPRPAIQTFQGAHEKRRLDADLASALRAFNREHNVTTFMTLLAAFSILLSRWSGQDEVVIGTPVAGRSRRETEDLIGFFVNTLVLRIDLSQGSRFIDVVRQARQLTLDGHAHQDLPFERLVEALQPDRDLSRTPLFQVMINMLNAAQDPMQMSGLSVEYLASADTESKFDLTLYVLEPDGEVELSLVYNADLFSARRMAEMVDQLEEVVAQIVMAPQQRHANTNLVTSAARGMLPDPTEPLVAEWHGSIPARFAAFASSQPDRIAVTDPRASWSYSDLDARSNQLAHYLINTGLAPEETVVIYGHRSAALVWAILGVLKAGGAFLVLDPAYPASYLMERLKLAEPGAWLQLEAAGPVAEELLQVVMSAQAVSRLILPADDLPDELMSCSIEAPAIEVSPDQKAYLAFTSGSTGGPKGIVGTHRPLSHFLSWYSKRFELGPADRFSMLSGLAHDPLLRDIFTPLWVGGTLCIPAPEHILAPVELGRWLDDQKISVAHLTPALGQVLQQADASQAGPFSRMRLIVFGGELLPRLLVNQMRMRLPQAKVVNGYGTTETPQLMAYHVVEAGGDDSSPQVPLGRAIDGVQLLVITPDGRLAGIGEIGEIVVRTPYLSRGYLDDTTLTAERYARNPFGDTDTDRVYRTGDRGRYLPDGSVAFVGRSDDQVNIRGFRVELGAVEEVLARHPGISACAVSSLKFAEDETRLVAYVVPGGEEEPDLAKLQEFLGSLLPDHMVPSLFEPLAELPLTPNGKLDRKRLPQPTRIGQNLRGPTARVKPRTPVEVQLCTIWEQILAVPGLEVGVTDNFFELGGHSLQAVRMFSQLNDVFDRDLPLETLFLAPTIEKLAGVLSEGGWNSPWKALVAVHPGGSKPPLFLVPGLGGNVLTFVHLANLLGTDQPLYGFQSRGLDGHETPFTRVDKIAQYYLDELRQFKPTGPYLLGGACMGGSVAFEMAQRLVAAGEKVDLLAFIEPSRLLAVGPRARLRRWALGSSALTKFFSLFRPLAYLLQRASEHLRTLSRLHIREWIPYIRERTGTVKEMIQQQDVFRGDSDFVSQEKVLNANFGAMRSYQPKDYGGKIHVILASDRPISTKNDARLKWIRYAGGGHFIDYIDVKDSGDMFIDPFVHELAEKLAVILHEVGQPAGRDKE